MLAVPVAPSDSLSELRREADDIVCLEDHSMFEAIGFYYHDFRQVSDEEVIEILHRFPAGKPRAAFWSWALIRMDLPRAPECSSAILLAPGTGSHQSRSRSRALARFRERRSHRGSELDTGRHPGCAQGCHWRATGEVVSCRPLEQPQAFSFMVAIAIFSVDPVLRGSLEQLPREDPAITVVGIVDSPSALVELAETHHVDVVLAETLPRELLTNWQVRHEQTAWVLIPDRADEETSLDALSTGASAVLPRTADRREIATAIRAVTKGLVVFQRQLLAALLNSDPLLGEQLNTSNDGNAQLTARELEVLTAMADGATNKAIARRLGISFHTVKFHVAAILEKLDADTRTEAVMKAAQLGIVML